MVNLEVEDSVLVGQLEACGVSGGVGTGGGDLEGETVEGRKHGEFELDFVTSYRGEWYPVIPGVFRQLDFVCLTILAFDP